eukprot:CAMPEP_0194136402 /NCGR_PEP_ID=MMETSP0152-20130528/6419_1 /TAXON_ID=1049557 /ORGANISM="Thalassiothrix antarctica, Strain L6-D1" /LENGTH=753 /DNA_ID=CAMNT_0038833039 /DNA_START=631 /DNA_END=2892 /DNA_ORIENTATION=+
MKERLDHLQSKEVAEEKTIKSEMKIHEKKTNIIQRSSMKERLDHLQSKEVTEEKTIKSEMKIHEKKTNIIQREENNNTSDNLLVQESGAHREEVVAEPSREKNNRKSDVVIGESPHISSDYVSVNNLLVQESAAHREEIVEETSRVEDNRKSDVVIGESPHISSGYVSVNKLLVQESGAHKEEEITESSREKDNRRSNVVTGESPHISSGYWRGIDGITSLGLSYVTPQLRLSRYLRPIRKAGSKATGLSGLLSGKRITPIEVDKKEGVELDEEDLKKIRRRITRMSRARKLMELKRKEEAVLEKEKGSRRRRGRQARQRKKLANTATSPIRTIRREDDFQNLEITKEDPESQERKARIEDIDKLILEGQQKLQELVCEKDSLQERPNPLYNYSASPSEKGSEVKFSREFNFPSDTLVDDYLDEMFATGRLVRMNHTHLWQNGGCDEDDDDDETIGDDLLTEQLEESRKRGGGNWFLRQSLGRRGSLGMKIGEITEDTGYKSVCKNIMAVLAQMISAAHGVNMMTHSDIRLYIEKVPDLPPMRRNSLPQGNYAQEAIKSAMFRGRKKKKKDQKWSEENFIQRDAVVETLLSHVQISAPLLKLFPLAWQRALLTNMITLITQIVSDFFDGIELQFLGHSLKFSFKPIDESDIIRHIGLAGKGFNHRRARPAEFEAAVKATAEDVGKTLQFLDRWHERALGSGMLRAQIANLIARLVLILTDEVLSDARMDLWAAQAGGPRVFTGLEYRTKVPEK